MLLISHGFEPNYVVGFARGLRDNGVPVLVASDNDLEDSLTRDGIPHVNIRGSQERSRTVLLKAVDMLCYYARLFALVYRNRRRPLHFVGLYRERPLPFEPVLLFAWFRLWSDRYVHTAHNILPHGRERSRTSRLLARWVYHFPHAVVVHTAKAASELENKFGVPRSKLIVISIGLNEEIPASALSQAEARRQLGVPTDAPFVLFFGKLERYKGVDVLIEAWDRVDTPGARLVVVGSCIDEVYRSQLARALARARRRGSIEWRDGFVPNDDIGVWLQACDVVVLPYRHIDQSGIVFLCLRFGVPMVATNVGSLAEYVDAGAGIIARSNDPTGIAAALDEFFTDRNRFDRASIRRSAEIYRWDRQCAMMKHLYA